MATDSLDRLVRLLERCVEEDRQQRRRERQRKKNPAALTESEKRIAEFLARGRQAMAELDRSQPPTDRHE